MNPSPPPGCCPAACSNGALRRSGLGRRSDGETTGINAGADRNRAAPGCLTGLLPRWGLLHGLLLFLFTSTEGLKAASILTNGEFTGSLAAWNSSGTVLNTGDSAVFSDSAATPLSIFQSGGLPADFVRLELSFDYLEGLSPSVPFGFLPDAFFGTLYLGGSPFGPTLAGGVYDQAIGLFDLDNFGLFNVVPGAVFGPSPKGAGWTRFSFTREMAGGFGLPKFATVAFESYNLNGTAADSVVAVDNVLLLAVVPEPGPATLLLLGMAGILIRRRRHALQS